MSGMNIISEIKKLHASDKGICISCLHKLFPCPTMKLILDEEDRVKNAVRDYHEGLAKNGTKQTVPGGHKFILDEDGDIDEFRFSFDYHNGLQCAECEKSWCQYCDLGIFEEKCPGWDET